jgi:ATP-dependent metalloprotease FtsH
MKEKKEPKTFKFNFYWIYAIIALLFLSVQLLNSSSNTKDSSWQEVNRDMLQKKEVQKLEIVNDKYVKVYIKKESLKREYHKEVRTNPISNSENIGPHYVFQIGSDDVFFAQLNDAQKEFEKEDRVNITYTTEKNVLGDTLGWIFPILIMIAIWMFLMKRMSGGGGGPGGQIFNIGKSKATLFDKTKVNVTFNDVAGLKGAKEEIEEIVDFLKKPKKYTALGGKIPRGAILVGPPGTGKTLLAKAVAGEAQVPFFSLSGSDFVEMFVGVGASRVRDLFKQAKEKAPSIIFIDEIDAIGRARGKNNMTGGNDERENTLNQLLTEMDGFGTNSGVIVIAATNRSDVLDRALLRAGRFDRQIYVDLPDVNERKEIFSVHIKPLTLEKNVDIDFLSKQTPGFSGADIANVCNESALIAARKNKKKVGKQDFLDAVDRIIGGLEKKNKIISKEEKRTVAFHEAGHATVSWFMQYASPLVKVTIVPRGRSLGAAWYLPEERQLTTTEQMLHEMCATLGGRAAEQVIFNKISTGALSDLEKVTKQAYSMVTVYGLNKKIGNISFYDSSGGDSFTKPYSEATAKTIDEEVSSLIEKCYQETIQLLSLHKDKLTKLAELLLEKEVIFKEDLLAIFGPRPWDKAEEIEVNTKKVAKKEPKKVVKKTTKKVAKKEVEQEEKSKATQKKS